MMTIAMTALLIVLPVLGVIPVHMANTLPAPEEVYDSVDITVTDPDGMARSWDDIDIKLKDIGVKPESIVDR